MNERFASLHLLAEGAELTLLSKEHTERTVLGDNGVTGTFSNCYFSRRLLGREGYWMKRPRRLPSACDHILERVIGDEIEMVVMSSRVVDAQLIACRADVYSKHCASPWNTSPWSGELAVASRPYPAKLLWHEGSVEFNGIQVISRAEGATVCLHLDSKMLLLPLLLL